MNEKDYMATDDGGGDQWYTPDVCAPCSPQTKQKQKGSTTSNQSNQFKLGKSVLYVSSSSRTRGRRMSRMCPRFQQFTRESMHRWEKSYCSFGGWYEDDSSRQLSSEAPPTII